MSLTVLPVTAQKEQGKFELFDAIINSLKSNKMGFEDGDILVISSKYISNSQGRLITLDDVTVSQEGIALSKKYQITSKIAEIVLRESDFIFGGITGFMMTSQDNIMAPNAGIDKSNAKKGTVILYPNNPYQIAEELKRKIFLTKSIHVGIIIIDSRLMPARIGTTGVAIACAGIEPVVDMRAENDLDGNTLKVTFQAVADNIASIANHKMGEGAQSIPIVLVRDSGVKLTDRKINPNEMAISYEQCVYVRSLKLRSPRSVLTIN